MKIVAISDTHGKHRELTLPDGDLIIHAGDFCHYGSQSDLEDFLSWYKMLDYQTKILIGGNHDFFAAESGDRFRQMLPSGIIYLEDSGIEIYGLKIWGSPVQPDLVQWAFGKKRGLPMKAHWDLIPPDTDILITHTPPYGILDQTRSGRSIGCEELTKRIAELDLRIHIFGHIHGSYGKCKIGNTQYFNASNMDSAKGLVNPPFVIEI